MLRSRSAGNMPESRLAPKVSTIEKSSTVRLRWTSERRGRPTGVSRRNRSRPACGEQNAGRAADHRQQQAFGQRIPHQAPLGGAERHAHGGFAVARQRASQLRVGQIQAGDQHQPHDGGHQQPQGRSGIVHDGLLHRLHPGAQRAGAAVAAIRRVREDLRLDRVELRRRLRQGDARIEPPQRDPVAIVSVPWELRHIERRGEKDGGLGRGAHGLAAAPERAQHGSAGEVEVGGQHADHLARNIAEADAGADHARDRRETGPAIAGNVRTATLSWPWTPSSRDKRAAQQRMHLKDVEEIRNGRRRRW